MFFPHNFPLFSQVSQVALGVWNNTAQDLLLPQILFVLFPDKCDKQWLETSPWDVTSSQMLLEKPCQEQTGICWVTPGELEVFFQSWGTPDWRDWILLCVPRTCLCNTGDENKALGPNPQVTGFAIISSQQRALGNELLNTWYPKINIFSFLGIFLVNSPKDYVSF